MRFDQRSPRSSTTGIECQKLQWCRSAKYEAGTVWLLPLSRSAIMAPSPSKGFQTGRPSPFGFWCLTKLPQ